MSTYPAEPNGPALVGGKRTTPPIYPTNYDLDGQPNAPETPGSYGVTVASVSPSTGAQGTTTAVTITGTHFPASPTVVVSGTGVSVTSIVRTSPKTITANFVATGGATASARSVTVAGTVKTAAFTVTTSG